MSKPMKGQTMGEDSELSLLALLEQLHRDRAAGLYRDLTAYSAANPELSEAFLELALAAEWEEYWEELEEFTKASGGSGVPADSRPLSPGVRRALASIPEFSQSSADSTSAPGGSEQRRRVAEKRPSYRAHRPGKRSDP